MSPAGEMWSVVTESPSSASTRAPSMSASGVGLGARSCEEGRLLDVGRLGVPGVECRRRRPASGVPALVALEDAGRTRLANSSGLHARADARLRSPRRSARCRAGRPACRSVSCRAARSSGRCRPCRPGRRPPPAAARPGSWPAPAGGCGPRSCGCRESTAAADQVVLLDRRRRRARAAGRCCRCRSCSRSRPGGSPAPRGRAVRPASVEVVGDDPEPGARLVLTHGLDAAGRARRPSWRASPAPSMHRRVGGVGADW